jgi:hypothetical protein
VALAVGLQAVLVRLQLLRLLLIQAVAVVAAVGNQALLSVLVVTALQE